MQGSRAIQRLRLYDLIATYSDVFLRLQLAVIGSDLVRQATTLDPTTRIQKVPKVTGVRIPPIRGVDCQAFTEEEGAN